MSIDIELEQAVAKISYNDGEEIYTGRTGNIYIRGELVATYEGIIQ